MTPKLSSEKRLQDSLTWWTNHWAGGNWARDDIWDVLRGKRVIVQIIEVDTNSNGMTFLFSNFPGRAVRNSARCWFGICIRQPKVICLEDETRKKLKLSMIKLSNHTRFSCANKGLLILIPRISHTHFQTEFLNTMFLLLYTATVQYW